MGAAKFVGLALGVLQFKGVEHAGGYIQYADWLLQGGTVIRHYAEISEEEAELSFNVGGKVVVVAVDRARSEYSDVREHLLNDFLSDGFGLEIERGRVLVSSGS